MIEKISYSEYCKRRFQGVVLEIKIYESWVKVGFWIFRSWNGERRKNGKPYIRPVHYLGSSTTVKRRTA